MAVKVWPITNDVLGGGADPTTHCISRKFASLDAIDIGSLRKGDVTNVVRFVSLPAPDARMGIFAVEARGVTRSFVLALPATGTTDRVMVAMPPAISQNIVYYMRMRGGDPRSPDLIRDAIALVSGDKRAGRVKPAYGTQVLTSKRPMALLFPVRALSAGSGVDPELGPFVSDGDVIVETLRGIGEATGSAFAPDKVEVFCHSNGVGAFNSFVKAITGKLNLRCVYGLDPPRAATLAAKEPVEIRYYRSGHTGGVVNGRPVGNAELMSMPRWANEPTQQVALPLLHNSEWGYLHSYAFPRYLLRLGIQDTKG